MLLFQSNVNFKPHHVDILRKVVRVLTPFLKATQQLSRDDACISEVVPIITQLRLELGNITDKDQGVKGLMRKLLDGVETRLGGLEKEEMYALSCSTDPRSWMSGFFHKSSMVEARLLLIQKVKEEIESAGLKEPGRQAATPVAAGEEETWEQRVKRSKLERQEEARVASGHLLETTVESLVDGYLFSDIQEHCLKFWAAQEPLLRAKGPAGQALLAVVRRYLAAPATSTAVERLFSVAGLILEDRRNKLSPGTLDRLLFVRESLLLGTSKLEW